MPNDLTLRPVSPKSLPASLQGKLRPEWADVYGEFGWEGRRLVGCSVATVSDGEREQAIAILQAQLRPCDPVVAIHHITRLKAATKARRDAEHDIEMLVDVLSDVLCEYPEDAVEKACGDWRANNIFFPAEAELRKLLDAAVSERRHALKAFQSTKPVDVVPPTPQRVQAREVDEIINRVAKKAGKKRDEISSAKPEQVIPSESLPGQSEAQIAMEAMTPEQRRAYVLKLMGAG